MLVDINPFISYVRSEYIHQDNHGKPCFQDATVFAISSYEGEPIRFEVMIDNIHHSRVQICALTNSKDAPKMSEQDCIYDICPSDDIIIAQLDYLREIESCSVCHNDNTIWQDGIYVFTIEWKREKQQLHLIELTDGNYVLWPSNLLVWNKTN